MTGQFTLDVSLSADASATVEVWLDDALAQTWPNVSGSGTYSSVFSFSGSYLSSLQFKFAAGSGTVSLSNLRINGQQAGAYLDNSAPMTLLQIRLLDTTATAHTFGRSEPDTGDSAVIHAAPDPVQALLDADTDLVTPDDIANSTPIIVIPNAPQSAPIVGSSARDIIYGSDFPDRIIAGGGDDAVAGNGGGDLIFGGAGNDLLAGGNGDDTLSGAGGDDLLFGNAGNDILTGGAGNDALNGGDGSDTITAGAGNDILYGGDAGDIMTGDAGNDILYGDTGNDILLGGTGNDTIYGGANDGSASGNDTISGGANDDTIYGEDGDDLITGDAGNDVIDGGSSSDQILGGLGNDTINGGTGDDYLLGEAGNDVLNGGTGDDAVIGGSGADALSGGDGNDRLYGSSIDSGLASALVSQNPDIAFSMASNSFYRLLAGPVDYAAAVAAAAAMTLNGVAGHLAVITSAAEQAAINSIVAAAGGSGSYWIGASDTNVLFGEGTWLWNHGPEITQQFSNNTGGSVHGFFTYWQGGAPANATGHEDYAAMNADNGGYWTANPSTAAFGYIIEWEGIALSTDTDADALTGGDGDDLLYGGSGGSTFDGGAGNDRFYGGSGNDIFKGGAGVDLYSGGGGSDTYDASTATGSIVVATFWDIFLASHDGYGSANESLVGIANITGGSYDDTLASNSANNTLIGGSGNDTITYASAGSGVAVSLAIATAQKTGGAGTDTISGFENLLGSAFSDTLIGDASSNSIDGSTGADTLIGGAGNDTYVVDNAGDLVSENASEGTDLVLAGITYVLGANVENLTLIGSGHINGTGNSLANTISGNSGNNVLIGGGGSDTVSYANAAGGIFLNLSTTTAQNTLSAGTDTISGFDNIIGSGFNDFLTGNANANTIDGGLGNDALSGGAGLDTVSYASATAGITLNLATTTAQNTGGAGTDSVSGFENILGSAFDDTLTGDANANTIDGGTGGNDVLAGGAGSDTVSYASATAGITLNLATTTAQNTGGAGTDSVSGFENILGSAFDDTLTGDANANTIDGGTGGNDVLAGAAGSDTLSYAAAIAGIALSLATTSAQNTVGAGTDTVSGFENILGSAFDDTLTGDANANTIDAGAGADTVFGGAGNDVLYGSGGGGLLCGDGVLDDASLTGADTIVSGSTIATTTAAIASAAGVWFSAATGNFYRHYDTTVSYGTAKSNAAGLSLNGVAGHGLTVGSGNENVFVHSTIGITGTTWVMATDAAVEGTWRWDAGPEAARHFWSGADVGAGGVPVGGIYNNWNSNDPSPVGDWAGMRASDGLWVDQGGVNNQYVVEWEGRSVMASVIKDTVTLYGGKGADNLYGGDGADVFLFRAATSTAAGDADSIYDFNAALDTIDISNLLSGYTAGVSDPDLFVKFTTSGADTVISVDGDGATAGASFLNVAILKGIANLNVEDYVWRGIIDLS